MNSNMFAEPQIFSNFLGKTVNIPVPGMYFARRGNNSLQDLGLNLDVACHVTVSAFTHLAITQKCRYLKERKHKIRAMQ